MNLNQQIDFMAAAANAFPLMASFYEVKGGGYKCKMCGAKVKDQNSATDHLLAEHREMEGYGTSEGVKKSWESRLHKTVTQHIKNGEFDADSSAKELHDLLRNAHHDAPEAAITKVVNDIRPSPSMEAREFSEGRRKKLAKSGAAMPGGGFPIVNREDLKNAKQAIGRAKNPAAARRHINERAKELGAKPIGAMESLVAGGPGSGRKPGDDEGTQITTDQRDAVLKYMREHANRVHPGSEGSQDSPYVFRASKKKKVESQSEFSPDMRLRMPKKAGTGQITQSPQYTGGQPPLQACDEKGKMKAAFKHGGMKRGGGCGSHGFHRGAGYESKAAKMGHRIPLSASAYEVIRQRPARTRRRVGNAFTGYKF